jgi:uncharacterized protein (TIGR02466 family)
LFSTPIALYEHPDMAAMNREITEILVAESTSVPSISVTNAGGWHSPYDLHKRTEACFRQLSDMIVSRAQETTDALAASMGRRNPPFTAKVEMWAMVMREGDYTIVHSHAGSHWASVYYADAGDADESVYPDSGEIAFVDPRSAYAQIPGVGIGVGNFVVNPKAGQLLLFPGWLMHFVHVYRGQRPRVSLACNVTFEVANGASGA